MPHHGVRRDGGRLNGPVDSAVGRPGLALPAGLTHRPLRLADAGAVFAAMADQERHDVGEAMIDEADLVASWQRPSFDISASTVGVFDGDVLVAYAEVSGGDRGDAVVRPAYRGRGIGTALAGWMQHTARSRGAAVVGMPVPAGSAGERLLRALGYRERWTSWTLELPPGTAIPSRLLPPGYAVRAARQDEYEMVHAVIEDAFLEWADRPRQSLSDFQAQVLERPGFQPWMVRVALAPMDRPVDPPVDAPARGTVVGAAVVVLSGGPEEQEGFVEGLAVRQDQRGRGLAQALLVDAFAAARAHGAVRSGLSTDSRTGALSLYEKVGMRVGSTWVHLAVDL